jgi:hypothetical protein
MGAMLKKNFQNSDEVRSFDKGKAEIVKFGEKTIMKGTFEPGWKWSTSVKPKVGTESCLIHHMGYMVSGKMHIVMDDGTEDDAGPGDMIDVAPGHDAWVVGNEPAVFLDVEGGNTYAK